MLFTHGNNTTSHNHATVRGLSKTILEIYSLGPNLLEPKSRPSKPQQIPNHYMALKQKVKQVGENPLPLWSLSKTPETGAYALSSLSRTTLLLVAKEFDGRIVENFREKVEFLSLKSHTFPLSSVFSFFLLSLPLPIYLVKIGTREKSSQCHMSNSYWLRGLHLILLSNHLRFPSNGIMPCVTSEPHLILSLNASALDTWCLLATQNVPSVLHPSRCLEKREIPTVSEFNEIRRGS